MNAKTGPALGGARLRGHGVAQEINEGAARHVAEVERLRAEATHQRSQIVAPIGRVPVSTAPKALAPGSTVWRRAADGGWWPAVAVQVLGGGLDHLQVDCIASGGVPHSDLVEHRRRQLRVFADRAAASQADGPDVASAT